MEYLKKSFSVPLGGKDYGEGWDRIFGKKAATALVEHEPSPWTETVEEGTACFCLENPCPCACHAA